MSKILISFMANKKPDKELANFLENYLKKNNHFVIISPKKNQGKYSISEIEDRIRSVDFLILLLSKASIQNKKIQDEAKIAQEISKKSPRRVFILPIRIGFLDGKLPIDLDTHLDPKKYIVWEKSEGCQSVCEKVLASIKKLIKRQNIKDFLKTLLKVFLLVLPLFNFGTGLFTSLTLLNGGEFIKTHGSFLFIFIWAIVPISIALFLSILIFTPSLINVDKKLKRVKLTNAVILLILLVILGSSSYQDSKKTYLMIISENPIYQIELESINHKMTYYKLEPERIERDKYILNQRVPFGNYNITVIFTSVPNQFFSRTFRTRTDSLIIF